jgi:hypothetical protein
MTGVPMAVVMNYSHGEIAHVGKLVGAGSDKQ